MDTINTGDAYLDGIRSLAVSTGGLHQGSDPGCIAALHMLVESMSGAATAVARLDPGPVRTPIAASASLLALLHYSSLDAYRDAVVNDPDFVHPEDCEGARQHCENRSPLAHMCRFKRGDNGNYRRVQVITHTLRVGHTTYCLQAFWAE